MSDLLEAKGFVYVLWTRRWGCRHVCKADGKDELNIKGIKTVEDAANVLVSALDGVYANRKVHNRKCVLYWPSKHFAHIFSTCQTGLRTHPYMRQEKGFQCCNGRRNSLNSSMERI